MYIPPDSYYLPIWAELKDKGRVSITANRLLHSRIIKAVIKRKWLDLGFKLQHEPYIFTLSHARQHSVITFFLEKRKDTLDFRSRGPITIRDI